MRSLVHPRRTDFRKKAVLQLLKALDPDTGYRCGVPYDFGSLTKAQVFAAGGAPTEDRLVPDSRLIDCQSPMSSPPMSNLEPSDLEMEKIEILERESPLAREFYRQFRNTMLIHMMTDKNSADQDKEKLLLQPSKCSGCWKKADSGVKLLFCAKCRKAAYCSRQCQAWDWKEGDHKMHCNDNPPVIEVNAVTQGFWDFNHSFQ